MPHKTINSPLYGNYVITHLADVDFTIPDTTTASDQRIEMMLEWIEKYHPRLYFSGHYSEHLEAKNHDPRGCIQNESFRIFQPIDIFNGDWYAENYDCSYAQHLRDRKARKKAFPLGSNIQKIEKWIENTKALLGEKVFNIIDIGEMIQSNKASQNLETEQGEESVLKL